MSIVLDFARNCLKSFSNIGMPAYVDLASMDRITRFPKICWVEFALGK